MVAQIRKNPGMGDVLDNVRPITLLNTDLMILAKVVVKRFWEIRGWYRWESIVGRVSLGDYR